MRTTWTREELDGHELVWLVEVHFPTGVVRFATQTIDVVDGSLSYHYPGTSDPMMYAEKADLFDGIPSPAEMGIAGMVDLDLPAMYLAGHRFAYLIAEVSQVRVKVRPNGLDVVDAYGDRCRLLTGRTRTPQWGRATSDGHTWFAADVVNEWFASSAVIPAYGLAVSDVTWPGMTRAADDEGVPYPIPIGYPGYDSASDFPVAAAPFCWLNRQVNPVVVAGMGVLQATTMHVTSSTNPYGLIVNLSQEYTPWGATAIPAVSEAGTLLTVVDYEAEGYDTIGGPNNISDLYDLNVDDENTAFVAFSPTTGGGILWRGQLLRGAGDVLTWALEQSGYRVDWGMVAAAAPWLNQYKIDTIISARVKASDWIQQQLIPLLPVSMMTGPDGIYPLVWRGNDVGPEDCIVIDADTDTRIEVSDTAFDDDSETANRFTVEYGWDAIVKATRFVVRVGPGEGAPESDDYAHTIVDDTGPALPTTSLTLPTARVRITARAKGFAGVGIQVNTSYQIVAGTVVTDGANSVDIDIDTAGAETAETIATAINAGSALVRATPERDTAEVWDGSKDSPIPATSRTFLTDYGTYPDARCEASRQRRRRESSDGIVDAAAVKAPIVMDHTTARGIATWMAAARADARTTVSVEAPDEVLAGLRPLSPVLLTYTPAGLVSRIGWAEEVERHSDGRTAARLVFLG
jgi:hypothetical protein